MTVKKNLLVVVLLLLSSLGIAQTEYSVSVSQVPQRITSGHLSLGGSDPAGVPIAFNSFYMSLGGKPFIPVMGEIHYCRVPSQYWEEALLKMKAGGINVVATYVFWNIHEGEEGVFDWAGEKDLRKFLMLCRKHGLFALVRIGPFCHGEIRNGGLPDWLYGRPFEVRSNDEGYLHYVRSLYQHIAEELKGLYYKDGGSVIGIQLENELQHSAAPWAFSYPGQPREMTTADYDAEITRIGVSVQDRKTAYADLGKEHLATLKKIAIEEGMVVPLYTVTGWGMAAVLDQEAIPVTAAYPYPFWAKPSLSPFFLFKDIQRYPDYSPVRYDGALYPSFCAEMGVGIQITYARRPRVIAEASEALMLRTLGSGANGIGYYMYHGGLTPQPEGGGFFSDEAMGVPKISYDFQAPIGEYGKTRDSYRYLKMIHLFCQNFGERLAPMGVVLPETNAAITPDDRETLRYAVRSDGTSGFVFLHNFQDHALRTDQQVKGLNVCLAEDTVRFPSFTLRKGVSAILPFYMQVGGALLKYATVQPLAVVQAAGRKHYLFYAHEGISPEYVFDRSTLRKITGKKPEKDGEVSVRPVAGLKSSFMVVDAEGEEIVITTLSREEALGFYQWENGFCITDATLMKRDSVLTLQSGSNVFTYILPADAKVPSGVYKPLVKRQGFFTEYTVAIPPVAIEYEVKETGKRRYTFGMKKTEFRGSLSDIILVIDYVGDNAVAFIDGKMVNDHLYYGSNWQIGLKQYADALHEKEMYLYFRPMYKDASYLIDFEKDKVPVFEGKTVCKVNGIRVIPEYSMDLVVE